MRHHRLTTAALAVSCLLAASPARADDTVFDFVAPRADQVGNYEPGAGAIVSGGVGTLAPLAGWFDEAWAYRLALTVANPGGALVEWPMTLVIDAATAQGDDVYALGDPIGHDWRVVGDGGVISRAALGYLDSAANRGRLWFQLPAVAAGDNAYHLYFGNPLATPVDDPLATFSYSTPYASRYALEPGGVDMIIGSLADDNDYATGALSGTLAAGELLTVGSADWTTGQAIAATAPFEVAFGADATSQGAPVSFARTVHELIVNRGSTDHFELLAPFADATVQISALGVLLDTLSLTAGVAQSYEANLPTDARVEIVSTSPVLVSYRGTDAVDGLVVPPPASEVWGVRSGTPRVLAVDTAVDVTVYDSTGGITTLSLAANGQASLAAGGSGDGDALRVVATDQTTGEPAPITIIANGDGDGGAAIAFHPESELGRRWVVPTDARFVVIASTGPGTTCTLVPADGSPDQIATTSTLLPARAMFGTTTGVNVLAGSVITCDAHAFAYYEDAATDDERNLFPMEAHRKAAAAPPTASLTGSTVSRYNAGTAAIVDTPDAVAATAVDAWTDFRVAVIEPAETDLAFQVSVDQGATWLVPTDATTWVEAAGPTTGADATAIRDAIGALDTSTGRIRVRTVMVSNDGITRPSVDAIRVFFDQTGAATRLQWDAMPETVLSGVGVSVVITAVDAGGTRITGLDGPVVLTASHGGDVFPATATLTAGRAALDIKLTGAGDDITLRAVGPDGIAGNSTPFDLVAPDGARLEVVGGDNQFGPAGTLLGQPLAVKLTDASDLPIGGAQVTFAVLEGNGLLMPAGAASIATVTDGDGIATARLQLGDVGAQRIRAEAAGETVELVARADDPDGGGDDDDGCGCRLGADGRRGSVGTGLLLLVALVSLRSRSRSR